MSMSINPVDLAIAAEGILNHQSLQQRERLLAASAQASRLLLGSPDAMKVMPEVLRLLGEAAQVDRTALAFSEVGPNGEKYLKIKAEWINEALAVSSGTDALLAGIFPCAGAAGMSRKPSGTVIDG